MTRSEVTRRRQIEILRHLYAQGRNLRTCADQWHLKLKPKAAVKLAIEAGLVFNDHRELEEEVAQEKRRRK